MRRWIALLLAPAAAVSAFVALVVDPTTGLVAGAAAVLTIGAVAVAGAVWRLAGEEEAAPAPEEAVDPVAIGWRPPPLLTVMRATHRRRVPRRAPSGR